MSEHKKRSVYREKDGELHDILPNGMRIYITVDAPIWIRQLFAVAWKNLRLCESHGKES